jgi:hypothetical protein
MFNLIESGTCSLLTDVKKARIPYALSFYLIYFKKVNQRNNPIKMCQNLVGQNLQYFFALQATLLLIL